MKPYALLAAFGTVLLTELLGDKSIFTIGTLATRFRPGPILCGITAAFMAKVLVAVALGRAIAQLPTATVAGISAVTFFATAAALWFKRPSGTTSQAGPFNYWSWAVLISFAAIFFSEWGDAGQITAATLAARYEAPVAVWLGASCALIVKGILALALGAKLSGLVPRTALRRVAICLCLVMGVLAALGIRS
jgi:putative Ca2+/H+ antiporter (TMEM165/GDT1 family)